MGTRNVTIIKVDNEIKVALYCQWDGYPTGQGIGICEFIKEELNLRKLKPRVRKSKFATGEEVSEKWKSVGADDSGFVTMDISKKFEEKFPELHRDTGSGILKLLQNSEAGLSTMNDLDYAQGKGDSFGCEYCYEIDLDKKTVGVYYGNYIKNSLAKTLSFNTIKNNDPRELMKKLEDEMYGEDDE